MFEGYNPDTEFLGTKLYSGKTEYLVTKEKDGNWTINCGAINGLRNDPESMKQLSVQLYKDGAQAGIAKFSSIGLNKSELSISGLASGTYKASVINQPPAVTILIKATDQQLKQWEDLKINKAGLLFTTDEANAGFDYVLNFENDEIKLLRAGTPELVHGIKTITEATMRYMVSVCKQVSAWHNLLGLENSAMTEAAFKKRFKTEFNLRASEKVDDDNNLVDEVIVDKDAILYISGEVEKYSYKLHLATTSGNKFYVAVYYMSAFFGIRKRTAEIDASVITNGTLIDNLEKLRPLKLPAGVDEDHDRFKLIISETPFFDHAITEDDGFLREIVEADEAELRGSGTRMAADDEEGIDQTWFAKTISIHLHRSNGKISDIQPFNSGKVSIAKHSSFSATAATVAVEQNSKSVSQQSQLLQLLEQDGQQVLALQPGSKSDAAAPKVIQLGDIQNVEKLKDDPLLVSIEEPLKEGEQLVALTMQDDIILPLAWTAAGDSGNSQQLEINYLPEDQPDPKKKNLLRAAWFCLVKIVTGKNLSKLRYVSFDDDEVEYNDDGIADKVAAANRIVLLVHGIIGNTKNIAQGMQFLMKENKYDLMLSYDYENLNTKIEEIAEDLKERLQKAGVGPGKQINIVAHSMGGLVSRYLIEHCKGTDGWVNKLYMFGTPNAGSELGKLPKWRDRLNAILTIACNVGKPVLGIFGPVLSAINKGLSATKPITNTLAQMNEESDFYKILNGKSGKVVNTKYYCIAGNLKDYVPADGSRFKKIMEKIEMQAGNLFYGKTPNDIAVAVDSIHTVPKAETVKGHTIPGHHLNYFETLPPMEHFKTLID